MCRELDVLRQSILEFAGGFDPASLTPAQAGAVVAACSTMGSALASVQALAAAVLADGESWKVEGYRSAAEQLADRTGTRTATARKALDTGRRLGAQPEVAKAALRGELSPDQASLVAQGAEANPSKAVLLVDKAHDLSLGELTEEVARIKAEVVDLEARRKELHAGRSMRFYKDVEGRYHTHTVGHPEDGATVHRVIVMIRRRLHQIAREQGRNEPIESLDYDALVALAKVALGEAGQLGFRDLIELGLFPDAELDLQAGAAGQSPPPPDPLFELVDQAGEGPGAAGKPPGRLAKPRRRGRKKVAGSPVKVIVRVDLDTLLRGFPLEGELCEIDGYGPVPVSVIEDLLANGNAFLTAALTRHKPLVGVYHHRRRANAYQQTGLDFIHPACAVAGCTNRASLQTDHRIDWAQTHFTVMDLLDRLCHHHHNLKTRRNWALVAGVGKRAFVPPTDPRHPDHPPSRSSGPPAGTACGHAPSPGTRLPSSPLAAAQPIFDN